MDIHEDTENEDLRKGEKFVFLEELSERGTNLIF